MPRFTINIYVSVIFKKKIDGFSYEKKEIPLNEPNYRKLHKNILRLGGKLELYVSFEFS